MPMAISVIGSAEAYSNVAVHAQITGQLTSVDFKEGGDVTKGEIIGLKAKRSQGDRGVRL
jgi:multidrug efflux pump subunit AcrA (membrane-fusion protein)